MRYSLIITETAPTIASLMGMILPQTSLKHKSHNKKNGGRLLTEYHNKERFKQQTK
ncbi:hypothetical protein ACOWMF_01300 [Helicobacter pylori]